MKVILLKNISGLGLAGEVKEVADGYAKNFLMPRKFADIASSKNINSLKQVKEKKVVEAEKDLIATEKLAKKLDGFYLQIKGKTNPSGKLYASISTATIASSLREKGFDVDKKNVELYNQIKELGEYEVKINLDHGLEAQICINVTD